jgi:exosortase
MSVSPLPAEQDSARIAADSDVKSGPAVPASTVMGDNRSLGLAFVLFGLGLALLYYSDLRNASVLWSTDEMYQHGWFIFPISAFLVYWRKDEIAKAARKPEWIGIAILALGLAMGVSAYVLQIPDVGMWSIVPTLAGAVIALHGRALWRIVGFSVCFLIFAGPLPGTQVSTVSGIVQRVSTSGAAFVSSTLGYPLAQRGNYIDLPQGTLEIADVCSGFKKLTSFLAFGCLWAYLFRIPPWRRIVLVLSAVPISILANIARISGLIAVTSAGGVTALHRAHDAAEYVAVILGFGMFMIVGRWLGCDRIRF